MSEPTYDQRGFAVFGTLADQYRAEVTVKESSDIEGNVWLFVEGGAIDANKGSTLLSPSQARQVALWLLAGAEHVEDRS